MDCRLPGSSVRGIFQARILEWVTISSCMDLPDPGIKLASPALQAVSLLLSHQGSPITLNMHPKYAHYHSGYICLIHLFVFLSLGPHRTNLAPSGSRQSPHFLRLCFSPHAWSRMDQSSKCPSLHTSADAVAGVVRKWTFLSNSPWYFGGRISGRDLRAAKHVSKTHKDTHMAILLLLPTPCPHLPLTRLRA